MATLGEKIRSLRENAKMSQESLGYMLGVSRQSVSLWETDSLTPKLSNIIALSEIFNVSTDYLLRDNISLPSPKISPPIQTPPIQNSGTVKSNTVTCETISYKPKKRHKTFLHAMIWVVSLFCIMLGVWIYKIVDFNRNDYNNAYGNYVEIHYVVGYGGKIEGNRWQKIAKGHNGEAVTAVPNDGYYFLRWSDGIIEPTRCDLNVQNYDTIKAEFAQITEGKKVVYDIVGFGHIIGNINQYVQSGYDCTTVTAQSDYDDVVFIKWSDGLTDPTRQDKDVTEDKTITAMFGYRVKYTSEGYGSVWYGGYHDVVHGCDADPVTAMPRKGYTFVGWSDGLKTPVRQDINVTGPIDVKAIFEWHEEDDFTYHYNYASGNNASKSIKIKRGNVSKANFIIPTREHFVFDGWFSDEKLTKRVTNKNGLKTVGDELFDEPYRELYAKWVPVEKDIVTYKILMVYITEIDAALIGNDGRIVSLNYKMSSVERKACEEISKRFEDELNYKMDGLVNFEVDTYYTKRPIWHDSFKFWQNTMSRTYYVSPEDIPELSKDVLNSYRKVMVTVSFNNEENLRPTSRYNIIDGKYLNLYVDMNPLLIDDNREEKSLMAVLKDGFMWQNFLDQYTSYFIQSITRETTLYSHNNARYSNDNWLLTNDGHYSGFREIDKLYMLNICPINLNMTVNNKEELFDEYYKSEKVGIPYGYWSNEILR